MIAIQVNGKPIELDGPTLLTTYLEILGVSPRAVAVEHNRMIIERDAYATTILQEGDPAFADRQDGRRRLNRQAELLSDCRLGLDPLIPGL